MTRQNKTGIPSRRTYLTDDGVIPISPQVAVMFGINAAAFLQQLHFLLSSAKEDGKLYNYVDGQWWVYYSYPNWTKKLPWLKPKTVQRIANDLAKRGVISTRVNPHKTWDRSLWYRLDYDVFHRLLDADAPSEQVDQMPSGQNVQMDADNVSRSNGTESPDVNITISNDLNKSLVANATAGEIATVEKKSTKRGKQPPKPRGECDHEPVYEAVERYLFEITDATADDPYLWDSPQGFVTRWLLGRIAKLRKAELGKIRRPAEAHHVETFVRWYRGKYKDAALPTEVVKFVKHWRAFGAEMSAKNNKQNAAADKVSDMMALMAHDLGMTEPKGA
jgi:hypothetical protein